MLRRLTLCALLALPGLSRADILAVNLELFGGYDKYDALGVKSGVGNLNLSDKALLKNANTHLGLAGILKLGTMEVGALVESGTQSGGGKTLTAGVLGGLGFDLMGLKLEALAELGGHRFADFLKDPSVSQLSTDNAWLYYLGLRPGLSYAFGSGVKFVVGIWGFARWDLTTKNVTVTPTAGGPSTTYKLGGSNFGASLRLGVSI